VPTASAGAVPITVKPPIANESSIMLRMTTSLKARQTLIFTGST